MGDPLCAILELPEQERTERGLEHTPREIWQQPATWSKTYQICQDSHPELTDVLRRAGIGRGSTASPTVYLVGAGTSDYTGRALAPLLRQRWGCDVWPLPSTTLLTEFEEFHRPGREYFWISFSRSGESPEGVALLEQALDRHQEIRHLVITCNPQGPMAQICARHPDRALALVLDDAVNDRGLAMTSSFSNMVLAGQCVGHLGDFDQFGEVVAQMSETGRQFLPAAAESATAKKSVTAPRDPLQGTETVLLVEDDRAVRRLASESLRRHGYTVLQSAGGLDAIAMAGRHPGPIHLLLTDVVMPQMNGRELSARLERIRPEMRTLFMSGYVDNVIVQQAELDGGGAFLQKPFTGNSLTRKVREALDAHAPLR